MVIAWTDAVLSESVTTLSLLESAVYTQETVISCNLLQLVNLLTTCFGLTGPSSGLQQMVLTKVHILVVPMGSHGLQFVFLYILKKFNYWIKRWNNKMYKIYKIVVPQ